MDALRLFNTLLKIVGYLIEEHKKGEERYLVELENFVEKQEKRLQYERKIAKISRARARRNLRAGQLR